MDRIIHKDIAYKALSWLVLTPRVMGIGELQEAISLDEGQTKRTAERYLVPCSLIVESCENLVSYNRTTKVVQLTHKDVYDYLSRRVSAHRKDDTFLDSASLATRCLIYLDFDELSMPCPTIEELRQRVKTYQFATYAAQLLDFHVRNGILDPALRNQILAILRNKTKRQSLLQLRGGSLEFVEGQTLLHVLAGLGLADICRFLLDEANSRL